MRINRIEPCADSFIFSIVTKSNGVWITNTYVRPWCLKGIEIDVEFQPFEFFYGCALFHVCFSCSPKQSQSLKCNHPCLLLRPVRMPLQDVSLQFSEVVCQFHTASDTAS